MSSKLNKFGHENSFQALFHPYQFDNGNHAVEKEIDGKKCKYLYGISSGIQRDLHGERMSEKAISSFMNQANEGEILLYPDIHGIKASKDIGRLVTSKILDNNDWFVEYKLYDESDFDPVIHTEKMATIDSVWKQINGFPPYEKKIQKGFSVEGYVPDGMIKMNARGERVIEDVSLDGVVLCARPAYETGIANAIYKALDEIPPWVIEKVKKDIHGKLQQIVNDKETEGHYFRRRYDIEDAFSQSIDEIMSDPKSSKAERLEIIFDEYKTIMIGLLMSYQDIFVKDDIMDEKVMRAENVQKIFKELQMKISAMKPLIIQKISKKGD